PPLDLLAAASYLLQGRADCARAVLRAWGEFLRWHGRLAAKRRAIRRAAVKNPEGIYRGSIVVRYWMGRKRFGNML
ncbi:MAG: glycosyltransferase family 2 protein, partial [Alistipes sp.]|nr:glycosyltransferase family 2 protein [Alistipes sp.]